MKEINGTKYYSKKDVALMLGVSEALISARVSKYVIDGTRLGRFKYYTEAEIDLIMHPEKAEIRTK